MASKLFITTRTEGSQYLMSQSSWKIHKIWKFQYFFSARISICDPQIQQMRNELRDMMNTQKKSWKQKLIRDQNGARNLLLLDYILCRFAPFKHFVHAKGKQYWWLWSVGDTSQSLWYSVAVEHIKVTDLMPVSSLTYFKMIYYVLREKNPFELFFVDFRCILCKNYEILSTLWR